VAQTVTKADLMWSLQWMTDRVNWIWGHLAGKGDQTGQLMAETGWASAGTYQDPSLKPIVGNLQDAKDYYDTLNGLSFKVANAPVMDFMAYDVPWKSTVSTLFSENHFGLFGWTNLPKFITSSASYAPLTRPFAVVSVTPYNPNGIPYANTGQSARSTAYSYQLGSGSTVAIPWFWGSSQQFSNGQPTGQSQTSIPNPSRIVSADTSLTLTSPMPGPNQPSSVTLAFSATGNNGNPGVVPVGSIGTVGNLVQAGYSLQGQAAVLYLSFGWLHGGADLPKSNFVPVYEDFWAS
jgi:hypothetical protein